MRKKKRGRPRLLPLYRRDQKLAVWLSPIELEQVQLDAASAGVKVPDWVRYKLGLSRKLPNE